MKSDTIADETWCLDFDGPTQENTPRTWALLATPVSFENSYAARFGERWFLFNDEGGGAEVVVVEVASLEAAKLAWRIMR